MITPTPENFESKITKDPTKDTLHYWYKPLLEIDSLSFVAEAPHFNDTLVVRRREMENHTLTFSFDPSDKLSFHQKVNIIPSIPLQNIDESLINVFRSDSIPVKFSTSLEAFENRVVLEFEKQESNIYTFQAFPGAFMDFYGTQMILLKRILKHHHILISEV